MEKRTSFCLLCPQDKHGSLLIRLTAITTPPPQFQLACFSCLHGSSNNSSSFVQRRFNQTIERYEHRHFPKGSVARGDDETGPLPPSPPLHRGNRFPSLSDQRIKFGTLYKHSFLTSSLFFMDLHAEDKQRE